MSAPRAHRAIRIAVNAVMVLAMAACIVWAIVNRDRLTLFAVLSFTPKSPLLAAAVLLLLYAFKSLSVILFIYILYAAAGILFPLPVAIVLNLAGTAIAVSIPFFIARSGGADAVDTLMRRYPKLDFIRTLQIRNDLFLTFLIRVMGIFSCDIVSMYFGLMRVRYGHYLLGCLLGYLPYIVAVTVLGMSITDPSSPAFVWSIAAQVVLTGGSLIGFFLYRRKAKRRLPGPPSDGAPA